MKKYKKSKKSDKRTVFRLTAAFLAAVLLTAALPGTIFSFGAEEEPEVPEVKWYDSYVTYVLERGFMEPLEDGDFGAEKEMTRAMFVSALYEMKTQGSQDAENSQTGGQTSGQPENMNTDQPEANPVENPDADQPEADPVENPDADQPEADPAEISEEITSDTDPAEQFAAVIFDDVSGDEWFVPALEWAVENGIINGIDGNFCPDQTIDREMMAVMIQRASVALDISPEADWSISIEYTDLAEISEWAVDGVAFCAVYSIMSGNPDGTFAPKRQLTRAEGAAVLQRTDECRIAEVPSTEAGYAGEEISEEDLIADQTENQPPEDISPEDGIICGEAESGVTDDSETNRTAEENTEIIFSIK